MIAGIFDEFFGVPTHPFAVHAPVVLIPLATLVSVVVLVRPAWRERSTVALGAVSAAMVALLFVARESGEALQESGNVLGDVERHTELADQTFAISIVWMVVAVVGAGIVLYGRRTVSAAAAGIDVSRIVQVVNVLSAVAAVVTTVWLVMTGHAGAESRWVG